MIKIRIKRLKRRHILSDQFLKRIIHRTLKLKKISKGEITLLIADDSKIRKLNRKYLNRKGATDILAFNMQEGRYLKGSSEILGDIIISIDRARIQAKRFKTTLKKELALYVIHGLLHLAGYKNGSKRMETFQQKILNEFFKR